MMISETANPLSHRMWLKLGAKALSGSSMEFVRVLRPMGFGVSVLARSKAVPLLFPLASAVDSILSGSPKAFSLRCLKRVETLEQASNPGSSPM